MHSWLGRLVVGPFAAHPGKVVGLLGAAGGGCHLAAWTVDTGSAWPRAFASGAIADALAALVGYAGSHPAYLAVLLVGLALVVAAE